MPQTGLSQNGSSLFAYAFSKLRPEVFSHPIWIRFGQKDASAALQIIDDLSSTAKTLQTKDPSAACQILLICAVYQNDAGQRARALKTLEKAQHLAEGTGLISETTWALWGACAVNIQQGNYQLAANSLLDLHAALSKQNEWILAGFIDELKGYLFQSVAAPRSHSPPSRNRPVEELISITIDWLQNWGYSGTFSEQKDGIIAERSEPHRTGFFNWLFAIFSSKSWQEGWQSLLPARSGKHKVQEKTQSSIKKGVRDSIAGLQGVIQIPEDNIPRLDPSILPTVERMINSVRTTQNQPTNVGGQTDHGNQIIDPKSKRISIAVQMLGTFCITVQDLTLQLPSSRSLSLFKYLVLHHKQVTPREVLMDVFWPNADPETARNNLNVALYGLRRALRKVTKLSMIVYENGAYGLASGLDVWLDVEEFEHCIQAGQRFEARNEVTPAVIEYETSISIYQGDFLQENPYDEWTVILRERLRTTYLDMLDRLSHIYFDQERYAACITICLLLLSRDRCREDAHCLLMRCYSRQGQSYLSLRQYHICMEALRAELEVDPAPETRQLYEKVKRREFV